MRFSRWCAVLALTTIPEGLTAQTSSLTMTAPSSVTVATATAGSQPTNQTDQTARYTVNVVGGRMKITGHIDQAPPSGVTLTISLAAPSGAVSLGNVVLTTSDQDLVRYIPVGQYSGLTVTFSLSANVTAGVVPYSASSIVLTLSDDP